MAIQQEAKSNATASTGKEDKQPLSLAEALTLAQSSMADMETAITRIHSEVFREFREISRAITKTKSEISALQANDIRSERIPEAGRELIAVVDATEDATNCIMECAETIMTADPSNPATYHNVVNENVMAIFEACSFQDLTGQRISRVVETLEHIEKRVSKFAERVGVADQDPNVPVDREEQDRQKRKKDLLIHGPQNQGEGASQDQIDNLLDA